MRNSWDVRFVEIEKRVFKWFVHRPEKRMIGCLNFDLYNCACEKTPKKPGVFNIKFLNSANTQTFTFKATSDEEAKKWVTTIQTHIKASQGLKMSLPAPMTLNFWEQEQITEHQFVMTACTFDIILFKTNCV